MISKAAAAPTALLALILGGGWAHQAGPQRAADSLLSAALVAAEKTVIPKMRRETNLTWMSNQLTELTRLLARAGRYDAALRLINGLDAPDSVKAPAFAPIAVAALRAGDRSRARTLAGRLAALDEWTAPAALAEIAVAQYDAGNRAEGLRLAAKVRDPTEQAETFRHMAELDRALQAAREVAPGQMHIPSDEGSHWEPDYRGRQDLLLQLVAAFVDRGDLRGARAAMGALESVPDRRLHAARARALVEIARREQPAQTLGQALREIDQPPASWSRSGPRLGDFAEQVEVLSLIAERLASADGRAAAAEALQEARAAAGQAEQVPLDFRGPTVCAALTRIARAELALGNRQGALEALEHATRVVDGMPVPERRPEQSSSYDPVASAREDKVGARVRVAVGLELAGETKAAASTLIAASSELAAIDNAEWRGYAWRSVVTAYRETGKLDRALEILAGNAAAAADMWYALQEIPEEAFLAMPRERLWKLLDGMPASYAKVRLAARLAARLDAGAGREDADRLVRLALAAVATRGEDWETWLVALANEAPRAGEPGDEEQRRILRGLLEALQAAKTRQPKPGG